MKGEASFNRMEKFVRLPMSYDCEASSFVDLRGQEVGLVYSWALGMFPIQEFHGPGKQMVVLGRYAEDAAEFMMEIAETLRLSRRKGVIYVHNLQYDISFLYKLIPFDRMFLVKSRKVLYAKIGNLFIKDSLLLSGGRSLATIGTELRTYKVRKLVGELDYNKVRSPKTPLSEKEIQYQINDVLVLNSYVAEKIKVDGSLAKVPLTNTGYVRNALRDSCFLHYERYANVVDGLVLPPHAYWVLKQCMQGGYTHAAQHHVGNVLHDVGSYDIKSSYPAVILQEYFPMSAPKGVDPVWATQNFEYLCEKYCVSAIIRLGEVQTLKGYEYIISTSKVISRAREIGERNRELDSMGFIAYNGRIICANWLRIGVTELDWASVKDFYGFKSFAVEECYVYDRGRMPREIVKPMLKWFKEKTKLDGDAEHAIQYMISKNMLNAIPGCMEMDPVRDIYEYDVEERQFLPKMEPDMGESIEKYNNDKNRFLFYPWGVWILAHARRRLLSVVAKTGADHVYSDTDSEKLTNYAKYKKMFDDINKQNYEKTVKAAEYYGVTLDDVMPVKPNSNERAILGKFEFEGTYERFLTWGAKRYLVEFPKKKGKTYSTFMLTVAGLNKRMGCEWLAGAELDHIREDNKRVLVSRARETLTEDDLTLVGTHTATRDPFNFFEIDMEVPPDKAGRLSMKYIDEARTGVGIDYLGNAFNYSAESGVYATQVGYKMGEVGGSEMEGFNAFERLVRGEREEEGQL